MAKWYFPVVFFLGLLTYWVLVLFSNESSNNQVQESGGRVVIPAPLQVFLAFGDRYLAANFETIRLSSTGMDIDPSTGMVDGQFLLRGHMAVAKLNPCHEDNYYLANALLAWGGADESANDVLWAATQCRRWDFLPPFLYGFNQYFFNHNVPEAQRALDIAAGRDSENANAMKRFSIMIGLEEFDDEAMALSYLQQQQAQAKDPTLADSLQDRVIRLQGLILLRVAQTEYEAEYGKPLPSPQVLLETGLLQGFPADPLGIGYEFIDGQFNLRQLSIPGVERPQ